MNKVGTSVFQTIGYAVIYYKSYGLGVDDIKQKIESGEISISQTGSAISLKDGEFLTLNNEGRWVINQGN